MQSLPINPIEFLEDVEAIDQAINSHTLWLSEFVRALVCGLEQNFTVVGENPHLNCEFGRWFCSIDRERWEKWAGDLDAIDKCHQRMHHLAFGLSALGGPENSPKKLKIFDQFMAESINFKNSLRTIQFQIINSVCLVDQLTGAWNRSSMLKRVSQEFARSGREGTECCLCMMDLDHFKDINDRHGHAMGDEVLRVVVEIAKQLLRSYDSVFRYGGEEFLFCLPNIALNSAAAVMERIRQRIEAHDFGPPNGSQVSLTSSFGVAPMCKSRSIEENIQMADNALLRAKASGRNKVICWDVCMPWH